MNTYTQSAGGVTWTIGTPGTEQKVTLVWQDKQWPVMAIKTISPKGEFWLFHYQQWNWNPKSRPFDRDWHLALDSRGHVVVRAPHQGLVLWSLATGRNWTELPDGTTATMVCDDQPRERPQQPWQAQPHRDRPTVTQQAPRQSMGQRIAKLTKLLGLTKEKP
jgi:hypothetical protein